MSPEAPLAAEDLVLCRIPSWPFDVAALEDLHRELEEVRAAHEDFGASLSVLRSPEPSSSRMWSALRFEGPLAAKFALLSVTLFVTQTSWTPGALAYIVGHMFLHGLFAARTFSANVLS